MMDEDEISFFTIMNLEMDCANIIRYRFGPMIVQVRKYYTD